MAARAGRGRPEPRVRPVPPDDALPPRRRAVPHLRGAARRGAVLVNRSGRAFMHRYDRERKDLAPRDVVTRAHRRGDDARAASRASTSTSPTTTKGRGRSRSATGSRRSPRPARSSGSTSRPSRSPSSPRRTTSAAASSPTSRGRRRSATSTPSAR
ncbi:MAG: FAD-binding protein [Candidatus Moduliflexus flocculans]|nr:FAD-binding protein [Candidatus Moduliflexus flocculans]